MIDTVGPASKDLASFVIDLNNNNSTWCLQSRNLSALRAIWDLPQVYKRANLSEPLKLIKEA